MESQMLDKSCKDFLTDLASKEPTPGGGGAAALAGAIAAALTSMVGGNGRALDGGDYADWLLGNNSDAAGDKWNNLAGLDFRVRFPHLQGAQLYGEVYGEDQANYMPSHVAERIGVYLPRLADNGAWDLRLEYAHTSAVWYEHQLYTSGWQYEGDIIGDPMGRDARKLYVGANRYLNNLEKVGFHAMRTELNRSAVGQQVDEFWVTYDRRLQDSLYLDALVGVARIDNAGYVSGSKEDNTFARVGVRWTY